ncbi:hypothetical protein [Sporolactobacillus terrae]|uniref:hypothetical protein n=1 Tax=Sporolactobacillus terrae TaxID=269673 RepID=UPI00048B8AB0|nr:hypothetical protein [Sporolactobacillus terrae]
MNTKVDIKFMLQTLAQSFSNDVINDNRETFDALKNAYDKNPNRFLERLDIAYFDFGELIEVIINIPEQPNKGIIRFIGNGLYDHFHEKRIEKLEGSSCCSDKSRFIRNSTLRALKEQKNLSLYDDYGKVDRIKEDKERQAYWSPTTVKDTDEAMKLFWDWYQLRK